MDSELIKNIPSNKNPHSKHISPINISIKIREKSDDLSRIKEVITSIGVRIFGIALQNSHNGCYLNMVVNDLPKACEALQKSEILEFETMPVLVLGIKGLPDRAVEIASIITQAGIELFFFYLTINNKLVLGVESVQKSSIAIVNALKNVDCK